MTTTIGFYWIRRSPGGQVLAEMTLPESRYRCYTTAVSQPVPLSQLEDLLGSLPEGLEGTPRETLVYLERSE